MTRIIIISEHNRYFLFLNSTSINWSFYTLKFNDIHQRILGYGILNPLNYHYCSSYNEICEHEISAYEKCEYEISACFCILVNRAFGENIIEVGNPKECKYCSNDVVKKAIKNIIPESYMLISPTKFEAKLFHQLKNECTKDELSIWLCHENYERYPGNSTGYDTYLRLNRYRYSRFIEYLIDCDSSFSLNDYIPLMPDHLIFSSHYNANYPRGRTSSLFEYDIYPIDLALQSQNYQLLRKLIQKGATKYTKEMKYFSYYHDWTGRICSILESAESIDDIKLAEYFIFDKNGKKDILNLFKINPHWSKHSWSGYSWCEGMEGDERDVLTKWYAAIVRIGDIGYLENWLSKYSKQLFWLLEDLNPYTTIAIEADISMQKDISTIPIDMIEYVKKNVIPYIGTTKLKSGSYKNQGIWGYDAVTGAPIRESDLHIQ